MCRAELGKTSALPAKNYHNREDFVVGRIEVAPDDFGSILEQREQIVAGFKQAGYAYVTLDLAGFRSGSLNEVLKSDRQAQEPLRLRDE